MTTAAPAASPARQHAPGAALGRSGARTRFLLRLGTVCGTCGPALAFPLVIWHPHLPAGDSVGVLKTVLDFGPWLALHLALVLVLVLMLPALAAYSLSMQSARSVGWATVALGVGAFGTLFAVLGQAVDGVGLKVAADVWRSAGDQQSSAVLMAVGVSGVAASVFLLVLFFYFGLTSLAYGLAFVRSTEYPTWLGLLALLGGVLGSTAGAISYFDEFSDLVYHGLFIPSAACFLLWVLAAAVLLRRGEGRPAAAGD